ncbi:glyoxalase [Candidatus Kaiserbacteria bacterium CG10_big_fil_rev_8_21_14_0_10_51_14]|uniref:Glyoxalase n=1 Tax=Candidatus Kaiserbacteria bacterium CG10_big_fil_rev_8_21_14_0_10_51_14 TaxID=1974610 RepID=A0A2H0UC37_9BACT|nr:MAG: glyoxalase [Candidatus Kaiserbacteria bacterium CG10_big_fil_rev_8_21_14_0_10_51_14]
MNPVVHFEMPSEDMARTKKFYEEVFGWQMNQLGAEMGNYLLAGTTETDEKTQRPKTSGAINGGFYPKGEFGTSSHVVISVPDIRAHIEKVKGAGGTIEGEPIDIPGIGTYVMFHDTEGNRVGMLQPKGM